MGSLRLLYNVPYILMWGNMCFPATDTFTSANVLEMKDETSVHETSP